jgi:hypothetical protein
MRYEYQLYSHHGRVNHPLLKHHFDMGYSPANATRIASGDVTFEPMVGLSP